MSTVETLPAVSSGHAVAVAPAPQTVLVGDIITNPAVYEHVKNLAGVLANGAFTPKHLITPNNATKTLATCFRVAAQAIRWGFDPFGVADETYEVHGRLGYQGKLIIAVVNSRANLKGRLTFTYEGQGAAMSVIVSGQFADETSPRTVCISVAQAKTQNEMWTKDPEQKLAYSGAIKWARRHCPEVVMGVHIVEDLEVIAETEQTTAEPRLPARSLAELSEKFGASEEVATEQVSANNDVRDTTTNNAEQTDGAPPEAWAVDWLVMVNEATTNIYLDGVEKIVKDAKSLSDDKKLYLVGEINKRRKALK